MDDDKRKKNLSKLVPMKKPGIQPIKQIELGTKWRALVPEEFWDDVCPIPLPELVEKSIMTRNRIIQSPPQIKKWRRGNRYVI